MPVGQVVGVGIRDVVEAAGLGHEVERVHGAAPRVPAGRPLSGYDRVEADRLGDLGALALGVEILVLDPFEAVGGDLPAGVLHGRHLCGRALEGSGDAIDGGRYLSLGEKAVQPPEAGARTIFVDRFHVPVALGRPGLSADDFREKGLRGGVAVKHAILSALLVIDHELHGDPGAIGPGNMRVRTMAQEIAGISHDSSSSRDCLVAQLVARIPISHSPRKI